MELPQEIPVMTLPNAILFPGAMLPLYVFETRYKRLLSDSLHSHRLFAVAKQRRGCKLNIPSTIAGLGMVRVAVTRSNATSYVIVQGLARVALGQTIRHRPYRIQRMRPLQPKINDPKTAAALTDKVRDIVADWVEQGTATSPPALEPVVPPEIASGFNSLLSHSLQHFIKYIHDLDDPGQIADLVSFTLLTNADQRQLVLETLELESRLQQVIRFLMAEMHRKIE